MSAEKKKMSIEWKGNFRFEAINPDGLTVNFDAPKRYGGEATAPSPMETLLACLAGCTSYDVVSILKKKRQRLESLEVICSGERAADPPQVWKKLEVVYRLRGALDESAVKRAIELSEEKYCSVSAMLQKTATLTWRHEVLPPTD